MKIKKIFDKNIWENFLLGCRAKTFLQSWNWGEFHQKMGNKIWRLGIMNGEELIGTALTVKISAKRGTFLMIQHGPIIQNYKSQIINSKQIQNYKFQILNILLEKLKEIAGEEGASFIRIAPLFEKNEENKKIFQNLRFREAPMHIHTYEATLKLDIKSEQDLLKNMRQTTRYLIKQAEKNKEIIIFQSLKIEDIKIFEKLQKEVAKKQNFIPFSLKYLENEFEVFIKEKQISLFFGKYREKIIAGAMVIFWSKIGFYHYAALLPEYRKIPLNYLLQWEIIKEAKKRECELYDFWGYVDPKKKPKHPWAGPTLFKMGFGGQLYEYTKTQDLPLSWKYWLTYIFEKIRKNKRRL
jgi:lipid II:glycine glycyltransferase (peptidoglycan interpeptide bridge formation enzyme)